MVSKTKIFLGVLLLVILSASIYVVLPDNVRIDVQKTKTLISVWEGNEWVLGATEYVNLFDGSKKMRAKSRVVEQVVDDDLITITRTSTWKEDIVTTHSYVFDSTISDVELIPIREEFLCVGCVGKIVHFEYRDILYGGVTRPAVSPESFGHKISVEWEDGYDWAKVYQSKWASDKLVVRYRPTKDVVSYSVRVFDPPVWVGDSLSFSGPSVVLGTGEVNNDSDGLVSLWDFNENALDSGPNGNDGVTTNITNISAGRYGGAILLNGNDSFVDIVYSSSLNLTEEVTIMAWIKPYDTSKNFIMIKRTASSHLPYGMWVDNTNFGFDSSNGSSFANSHAVPGVISVNEWQHVAVSFKADNESRFYVNGNYVGGEATVSNMYGGNTQNLRIGVDTGTASNDFFNGTLDEVSIWNSSLSDSQVYDLYSSGVLEHNTGEVNNVSSNLSGLWRFNGNALDSSSNGFDGSVVNMTNVSAGRYGAAYYSNGTGSSRVDTGLTISNSSTSYSAWVKTDSPTMTQWIISTDNGDFDWSMLLRDGKVALMTGTGSSEIWKSSYNITTEWINIVAVFDADLEQADLYINGEFFETAPDFGFLGSVRMLTVGSYFAGLHPIGGIQFNGTLDEVSIWNRSLSDAEIYDLYSDDETIFNTGEIDADSDGLVMLFHFDGNANDSSGNNFDGVAHNTTNTSSGRYGAAYDFNGSSSNIDLVYNNLTSSLSYSFWVYPTNASSNNVLSYMATLIRVSGSSLVWFPSVLSGSVSYAYSFLDKWSFVVITQDDTEYNIYINGELVQSGTSASVNTEDFNSNYIGRYTVTSNWEGTIDEFAMWNRTLTAKEVRGLYT